MMTENAVQTDAPCQLLSIERDMPDIHDSGYDVRRVMNVPSHLRGGKPHVPIPKTLRKRLLSKLDSSRSVSR